MFEGGDGLWSHLKMSRDAIVAQPELFHGKNPVQLLHEIFRGVEFETVETPVAEFGHSFRMRVKVEGESFEGSAGNKKAAKAECAIAALTALEQRGVLASRLAEKSAKRSGAPGTRTWGQSTTDAVIKLAIHFPDLQYRLVSQSDIWNNGQLLFSVQVVVRGQTYVGVGRTEALARMDAAEKVLRAMGLWTADDERIKQEKSREGGFGRGQGVTGRGRGFVGRGQPGGMGGRGQPGGMGIRGASRGQGTHPWTVESGRGRGRGRGGDRGRGIGGSRGRGGVGGDRGRGGGIVGDRGRGGFGGDRGRGAAGGMQLGMTGRGRGSVGVARGFGAPGRGRGSVGGFQPTPPADNMSVGDGLGLGMGSGGLQSEPGGWGRGARGGADRGSWNSDARGGTKVVRGRAAMVLDTGFGRGGLASGDSMTKLSGPGLSSGLGLNSMPTWHGRGRGFNQSSGGDRQFSASGGDGFGSTMVAPTRGISKATGRGGTFPTRVGGRINGSTDSSFGNDAGDGSWLSTSSSYGQYGMPNSELAGSWPKWETTTTTGSGANTSFSRKPASTAAMSTSNWGGAYAAPAASSQSWDTSSYANASSNYSAGGGYQMPIAASYPTTSSYQTPAAAAGAYPAHGSTGYQTESTSYQSANTGYQAPSVGYQARQSVASAYHMSSTTYPSSTPYQAPVAAAAYQNQNAANYTTAVYTTYGSTAGNTTSDPVYSYSAVYSYESPAATGGYAAAGYAGQTDYGATGGAMESYNTAPAQYSGYS